MIQPHESVSHSSILLALFEKAEGLCALDGVGVSAPKVLDGRIPVCLLGKDTVKNICQEKKER